MHRRSGLLTLILFFSCGLNCASHGIAASSGDALTGSVQVPSQLQYITNYGIKCDGVTDNTAAFAEMESRAPASDVLATPRDAICAGKYVIATAHRSLFLSAGSSIKCPSSEACDAVTVNAPYVTISGSGGVDGNRKHVTTSIGIQINGNSGASHVTIRDIAVAHTKNDGKSRGYGIRALDVPYLDVENIYVTDTGGIGVFTNINGNADVPGLRLERIRCDRAAEGVDAIGGCIFSYNNAGHGLGRYFYTNAIIENNSVYCPIGQTGNYVCLTAQGLKSSTYANNVTSGSQLGHSVVSSDNLSISNNTAYAFSYYGLELSRVSHSTATGTRCDGGNAGTDRQHCVLLDGSTSYVTINDTRATNIASDIVLARPTGGTTSLTDITINGTAGTAPRGKSCIYMQNIRNFSVSGGDCDGAHLGANYGVRLLNSFPGHISQFKGHDLAHGVDVAGNDGETIDNISIGPNDFEDVSDPVSISLHDGSACGSNIMVNEPPAANREAISYSDFCHRIMATPVQSR